MTGERLLFVWREAMRHGWEPTDEVREMFAAWCGDTTDEA